MIIVAFNWFIVAGFVFTSQFAPGEFKSRTAEIKLTFSAALLVAVMLGSIGYLIYSLVSSYEETRVNFNHRYIYIYLTLEPSIFFCG